jgi:hypothetical protein
MFRLNELVRLVCEVDPRHNENVGRAGISREYFCDEIARTFAYRYVSCLVNVGKYPPHNEGSAITVVYCPKNPLRSHSFHLCGYITVTTVIIVAWRTSSVSKAMTTWIISPFALLPATSKVIPSGCAELRPTTLASLPRIAASASLTSISRRSLRRLLCTDDRILPSRTSRTACSRTRTYSSCVLRSNRFLQGFPHYHE